MRKKSAKSKAKFERCVKDVKRSGSAKNPWAVCHAALGKRKKTQRDSARLRKARTEKWSLQKRRKSTRHTRPWATQGEDLTITSQPRFPWELGGSKIPYRSERDPYHANEIALFRKELAAIEREKSTREEVAEWKEALSHDPELVAERIDWLLAGHYGQGSYLEAHKVIHSRGNAPAWLTQTIGALEWRIPFRTTRAEWNRLTNTQKSRLAHQVELVIKRNLKGE